MILQALYHLAERERLAPDLDFEPKPIGYLVHVAEDGRPLGPIQSTYSTPLADAGDRRKPPPRPKTFLVPREGARTSGDRAFFFVDKAEYVFGKDPQGERPADKLARRFDLFRARVAACAEDTGDAGAVAVRRLLDAMAAGETEIELPPEVKPNDLFAFVLDGEEQLVTERPAVRRYFKSLRRSTTANPVQCLITGRQAPAAELHTQVKYVPGAASSGVALVSFNAPAFESYGWDGNRNAPVSREAAETYAAALQRLLHPQPPVPGNPTESLPRRNVRLSEDTVVCYWSAEDSGDEVASILGFVLEGTRADEVGALYRSIWSGRAPEIADPSAFYAVTLSGAQGRVSVRSWLETTVADAAANLARYVSDLEVVRSARPRGGEDEAAPLSLKDRLRSLAPPGRSEVPAPLAARAVDCALRGDPFPLVFLTRAV
ncbi:MAG TPA: type I-C CRISPR-associated protein Cas8c/Csd1, partial [Thermoanaerobaculia bacterium]|nr:type I-C CRISPR-associated protein Cas8c/Csd1 [Thermoanaerobaculia bacterium]